MSSSEPRKRKRRRSDAATPSPPRSPGSVGDMDVSSSGRRPRARLRYQEEPEAPKAQHSRLYNNCVAQDESRAHFGDNIKQQTNQYISYDRSSHGQPQEQQQPVDLLEALAFDHMESRVASVRPALPDTCSWLVEEPVYLDWRSPRSNKRFLWIKGKPGSGKSTLMKSAFQHAKEAFKGETVIGFFFNARGHALENSLEGMYRSLLHQLLKALPRLRQVLPQTMPSSLLEEGWKLDMLRNYFLQAVQSLAATEVVNCYIDALDECSKDDIREAVSDFDDLAEWAPRIRILFSSRHYPGLTLKHCKECRLDGYHKHFEDIRKYLKRKIVSRDSESAEYLADRILARCDGVFFWVVCVVRMINTEYDRGKTHSELITILDHTPGDIETLLANILEDPDEALIVAVQLILCAEKPLELEEHYFALRYAIGDMPSFGQDFREVQRDTMLKFILHSSRGLIEPTQSNIPRMQFIHESVRQYFVATGLEGLCPDLKGNAKALSHMKLALLCQAYIRLTWEYDGDHNSSPTRTQDYHKHLASYAFGTVLYHMDSACVGGAWDARQLRQFPLNAYIEYHTQNNEIAVHPISFVYMAILGRRESLVITVLEADAMLPCIYDSARTVTIDSSHVLANLNTTCGGSYGHVLGVAVSSGFLKVARILLQHGADPNVRAKNGKGYNADAPLTTATDDGHIGIVQLLLDHGADANFASERRGAPLMMAIGSDKLSRELVQLLLTHGANPNAVHDYDGTPLDQAIRGRYKHWLSDHLAVVQMLLDNGADPNFRAYRASASQFAYEMRYHDLLEMFSKVVSGRSAASEPTRLQSCATFKHQSE